MKTMLKSALWTVAVLLAVSVLTSTSRAEDLILRITTVRPDYIEGTLYIKRPGASTSSVFRNTVREQDVLPATPAVVVRVEGLTYVTLPRGLKPGDFLSDTAFFVRELGQGVELWSFNPNAGR